MSMESKKKCMELLKKISIKSAVKGCGESMPNFMFEPYLSAAVKEEINKIKNNN